MGAVATETVAALHRDLAGAGSRTERADLVRRAARDWCLSTSRVRAIVRQYARGPGEVAKQGERKVSEADARAIAAELKRSQDRRGRARLGVRGAICTAKARGTLSSAWDDDVDLSTVHRRLDELRVNRAALEAQLASVLRVSTHSNHVHLVDFSVCAQWYFGDDRKLRRTEAGQVKRMLARLREHRSLRYKPEHFQGRRHLWRFVLVDHLSGALFVRYYYSPGERAEDLADFLCQAWTPTGSKSYPFAGVPEHLVADQGAPFRHKGIQTLLRFHGVELELHAAGNAKASGAVERAHRTWEDAFESRLRLSAADDIDQLNQAAQKFATQFCATARHTRHGMTRMAAWCKGMRNRALRVPPPREQFMQLATRDPITRVTDSYLRISVGRQEAGEHAGKFQLQGRVQVGETVTVVVAPFADKVVRTWNVHGEELTVTPLTRDEFGFSRGGVEAVFGSGEIVSHPHTPAQQLASEVERNPAAPMTMPEVFGADLAPTEIDFIAPRTTVAAVNDLGVLGTTAPLTALDVRRAALAAKGAPLTREESMAAAQAAERGLSDDDLPAFLDSLLPRAATG